MSCRCSLHARGSGIVSMYEVEDVAQVVNSLFSFIMTTLLPWILYSFCTTELCIYTSEIQIQTRLHTKPHSKTIPASGF